MTERRFDAVKLYETVNRMRLLRGKPWTKVAEEMGLTQSGLIRISSSAHPAYPSVPALLKILDWLGPGVRFEDFVIGGVRADPGGQ